jgi:hypothetical protein
VALDRIVVTWPESAGSINSSGSRTCLDGLKSSQSFRTSWWPRRRSLHVIQSLEWTFPGLESRWSDEEGLNMTWHGQTVLGADESHFDLLV